LCPYHHRLGIESAHKDPDFKDRILGRFEGTEGIRSETWYERLKKKAYERRKVDLEKVERKLKEDLLRRVTSGVIIMFAWCGTRVYKTIE